MIPLELVFFLIAASVFVLSVILTVTHSLKPYKRSRVFRSFYLLTIGVFITNTLLFFPLQYPLFKEYFGGILEAVLVSAHTALKLFIVDCDFDMVLSMTAGLGPILQNGYIILSTVLFILSPVLTASVVLSFFESLTAHNRYFFGFFKDAYVFSELNERSLSLARSLRASDAKCLIVFTDVFLKDDETSLDLMNGAKEVDGILFKNDIAAINFRFHSKKTKLYFFVIGDNESENIHQTIKLTSGGDPVKKPLTKKKEIGYDLPREDSRVYIFSTNPGTEQLLSAIEPTYIKLRRINDVQSLIYRLLYCDGAQIFDSAIPTENKVCNLATGEYEKEKKISALIIGFGSYGVEMTRALSWFAQMHPYRLEINVFDKSKTCDARFHSDYPDLFDVNPAKEALPLPEKDAEGNDKAYPYHNGDFTTLGEAHYKISIHTGYNVNSDSFDEKLKEFSDTTYIFVSLGDDDTNIRIATKLRILMKRMGNTPVIHAIVHDPWRQNALVRGRTVSGHSYDIRPYGDISSTYTKDCLLNYEFETLALKRHCAYVEKSFVDSPNLSEEEKNQALQKEIDLFWKYDYNYRSSVASVIHAKYKRYCHIRGSDLAPKDRSEPEKQALRMLEHQRWNAYVRSEGYVWAPVRDKMAKTHHLLVPFEQLPYEEQIKDDD